MTHLYFIRVHVKLQTLGQLEGSCQMQPDIFISLLFVAMHVLCASYTLGLVLIV